MIEIFLGGGIRGGGIERGGIVDAFAGHSSRKIAAVGAIIRQKRPNKLTVPSCYGESKPNLNTQSPSRKWTFHGQIKLKAGHLADNFARSLLRCDQARVGAE